MHRAASESHTTISSYVHGSDRSAKHLEMSSSYEFRSLGGLTKVRAKCHLVFVYLQDSVTLSDASILCCYAVWIDLK